MNATLPPSPSSEHDPEGGTEAHATTKALPFWLVQAMRTYALKQTMGKTMGMFEQFWTWLMAGDEHDASNPDVEDLSLLKVSIRKTMKEDARALFAQRGFFNPHDKDWYV